MHAHNQLGIQDIKMQRWDAHMLDSLYHHQIDKAANAAITAMTHEDVWKIGAIAAQPAAAAKNAIATATSSSSIIITTSGSGPAPVAKLEPALVRSMEVRVFLLSGELKRC